MRRATRDELSFGSAAALRRLGRRAAEALSPWRGWSVAMLGQAALVVVTGSSPGCTPHRGNRDAPAALHAATTRDSINAERSGGEPPELGKRPVTASVPGHERAGVPSAAPVDASSPPELGDAVTTPARPSPATPLGAGTHELPVPGFRPSVLSVPQSRGPSWLVVAAHGAEDTAAWQCEYWRELLGNSEGYVLCPAGKPIHKDGTQGDYFPNHIELRREVEGAVLALKEQLQARVLSDDAVYVAYSQGATMGALMLADAAIRFSKVLLIEGGYAEWAGRRARRFRERGGERVGFVCGTRHCERQARVSADALRQAGVAGRVWSELSAGHTYGGLLTAGTRAALDWLRSPATEGTF